MWTISSPISTRRWRRSKARVVTELCPVQGGVAPLPHKLPSAHRLSNPLQVRRTAILNANLYTLRKLVGMKLAQSLADAIKNPWGCLDHQQPLCCCLDLTLPAIHRLNLRS